MSVPNREAVRYKVAESVVARTQDLLREQGRRGQEGYVVWVGELLTGRAIVHDVWPVSASSTAAHAHVSLKDVLALDNQLQDRSWYILAQLHSHPGRAFHSSIDDEHPISNQRGFLSIVVPDFGAGLPGVGWSVYEYAGSGRWRNLSGREVKKRIRDKEAWWQRRLNAIIGRGSYSGH